MYDGFDGPPTGAWRTISPWNLVGAVALAVAVIVVYETIKHAVG